MTRDEALTLARLMRINLTQLQGQLTDILAYIDSLPAEHDSRRNCPHCGTRFKGPLSLAEHIHRSHDGPYPEHWAREDATYANVE